MSMSMKLLGLFCLATLLSLAGCSLPGARPQAISHYVLEVPAVAGITVPANAVRPILLLREAEAGGFSQSLRLVYSRAPGTQAQYQYARWNEAPPKRLFALLRQRLLASGLYAGVVPLGSGVQGDYQLNFRVLDFLHNAVQTPGSAYVKLEVELVQRSTARLIAQQVFVADVPIPELTAAAAAKGLGQASGQVLDATIAWLARVQPADAR
jgi:ABC-type uncharacterized transport system auxiliary subunit